MSEDTPIVLEVVEAKSSPKKGKPSGKKGLPRDSKDTKRVKILEMAVKNVAMSDIARAVQMPISTVKDILDRFEPFFKELPNVVDYRNVKSDILSAGQLAALKSAFSGKKLAKAGFLSTIQGFDILNKAERLENGQSTGNISVRFGAIGINNSAPLLDTENPKTQDVE